MLAALEESVGRQRRLVADASHELRTPLTAARTNVDLVREGKLPEEEVRHALDEASVELDSLTSLVSDLVELARGEERKLRLEDVALDDLVSCAVERAKARAPEATFVMSLTPVQVRVDPVLVERAVGNLLDNAVKYSPPGAPIEVSVREGEVVVADHGPGIAEEDLPRIFDRFYRAATARAKPGAGLGLAIVREAAEAHGGQATAESGADGARFRLTLPAARRYLTPERQIPGTRSRCASRATGTSCSSRAGQLLSTAGSSLSTIAYPLLVLALTHSPAQAGLVSFARAPPRAAPRASRRRRCPTASTGGGSC